MSDTIVKIIKGDITELAVDAIVNAANNSLLGGGGVDGAIHRAAGPKLLEECRTIGGCPTGDARITGGDSLAARHVIHTVGPVWHGGNKGESELLASAYRESLKVAAENNLSSISFPSISTGAYGYPVAEAAKVAISTVASFLKEGVTSIKEVVFVLFDFVSFESYSSVLGEIARENKQA